MTKITFQGNPLNIAGSLPNIGSKAPNFDLVGDDLSSITLNSLKGKKVLLNIFASIDTPTCAIATKKFNDDAAKHSDLVVLCVSVDLPFALARFSQENNLSHIKNASAFRDKNFGKDYGVEIIDGPLKGILSRAVVLIDANGSVIYTEHVSELADEPNYSAVLKKL